MSELLKRVLVAFVGIPIAIIVIYLGGIWFALLVSIISSLALSEYYTMMKKKSAHPLTFIGIIFNLILIFLFEYFIQNSSPLKFFIIFPILFIIYIIFILGFEVFRGKHNPSVSIAATLTGNFYISLSFLFLLIFRNLFEIKNLFAGFNVDINLGENTRKLLSVLSPENCGWLVVGVFVSVWICDSAAYFIGKAIGKHKLLPRVSPNKSWEGAIAGFFGGILGYWIINLLLIPEFPIIHSIIMGAIVGSVGQIGDLAESLIKRDTAVKDSSHLLPGHGGALDRFDSILFAVPCVVVYLFLLIIL